MNKIVIFIVNSYRYLFLKKELTCILDFEFISNHANHMRNYSSDKISNVSELNWGIVQYKQVNAPGIAI